MNFEFERLKYLFKSPLLYFLFVIYLSTSIWHGIYPANVKILLQMKRRANFNNVKQQYRKCHEHADSLCQRAVFVKC